MIKVKYSPYRLEVKGHAGSAPAGKDLVCCAVSTLAYTLMTAAAETDETVDSFDPVIYEAPGEIRVMCEPKDEARCTEMFRTICAGLEALAEQYPDYITYTKEDTDD